MILLTLLLALPRAASAFTVSTPGEQAPQSEFTALPSTATAGELAVRYIESIHPEEKLAVLERLAVTPAKTTQDLRAMLNLYSRTDAAARSKVEASLSLLTPRDAALGPVLTGLLEVDDPAFQQFALLGVTAVRDSSALPILRRLAQTPLSPEPTIETPPQKAYAWRLAAQAVQALALWEGDKCYPLLLQKAKEAPSLADPLARQFWPKLLPELVRWSESADPKDRDRALRAWRAQVPPELTRPTIPELRRLVLDKGKRLETTRHGAAVQLGMASSPAVVAGLLEDRRAAKDEDTRRLLTLALFASHDPQALPVLEEYVRGAPEAVARQGALLQFKDMASADRFRTLLRWVAEHDPDEENRKDAARQLAAP